MEPFSSPVNIFDVSMPRKGDAVMSMRDATTPIKWHFPSSFCLLFQAVAQYNLPIRNSFY